MIWLGFLISAFDVIIAIIGWLFLLGLGCCVGWFTVSVIIAIVTEIRESRNIHDEN